jgi:hypothetical protein
MNARDPQAIVLSAIALSVFLFVKYGALQTAKAEDNKVNGLKVVIIEGVYKYNSGGVPLFGYIRERLVQDQVKFVVCRTAKIIQVSMKLLQPVAEPCERSRSPTPAPWSAWYYSDGKLVSSPQAKKTVGSDKILVGDLPPQYQGLVRASKKGDPVAYSFVDYQGYNALGVITKPRSPD